MIALIVVNYRCAELTARAVRSVLREEPDAEVVVVDNSADPAETARLAAALPAGVRLRVSDKNLGFAAACNLALELSAGDPVMLLNPDAAVLPGALKVLRERLQSRPALGAVGPAVLWDEARPFLQPPARLATPAWHLLQVLAWRSVVLGKLVSLGFRAWSLRTWRAAVPVPQSMLSGCALMIRRSTLARIGGLFDSRFFLFYEDADLARRLRRAGLTLELHPGARVVHRWRAEGAKSALMDAARAQYFAKHFPRSPLVGLARAVERLRPADPAGALLDLGQPGEPPGWWVPPAWQPAWLLEVSPSPLFVPALGLRGCGPLADLGASVWSNLAAGDYFARLGPDRRWPGATMGYRWRVAAAAPTGLLEWLSARAEEPLGTRTPLAPGESGERLPERLLRRFGLSRGEDPAAQPSSVVRVGTPSLAVRAVDVEAAPAMLDLFSRAFGKPMEPALWRWKYGGRPCAGVAAWRGGQAVAHYGWIGRGVVFRGERLSCVQSCDVMTAPTERGNLSREGAYPAVALTFSDCLIGEAPKWPFSFGFPSDRHGRLGQRLGIFHPTVRIMERAWNCNDAEGPARSLALEPVRGDPSWARRIDGLWARMRDSLGDAAVCERDHRYFFWRFLGHPVNRYDCIAVSRARGRAWLGVVVVLDQGEWIELVDVLGALPDLPLLVAAAARFGKERQKAVARGWVSEAFAGAFGEGGLPMTYAGLSFVMVESSPPRWQSRIGDRWFVMAGDTDFH